VKDLGAYDEVLARAAALPIARGAYDAAVKMYPGEAVELRQGGEGGKHRDGTPPSLVWGRRRAWFTCRGRALRAL